MNPDQRAWQIYGREVRRLRQDAGLTLEALGHRIGRSRTQLSAIERGKEAPSSAFRNLLEKAIGHGRLERLWDDLTGDGRAAWRTEIATAIQEAEAVYEYQALAFPSYLQTESYARAIVRAAAPWMPPDELNERVNERVERAQHLSEASRPMLWLVIDGSLLGRRYGGTDVTREQLAHLLDLAERERVTLQIVPADHPRHPGNSGSFRVLTMPASRDVAYVESAEGGQMLLAAPSVSQRRMLFAALQGFALDPETSIMAVHEEMKRL